MQFGVGVSKDLKVAARHFKRTADQGAAQGQYHWAMVVLAGICHPRDIAQSDQYCLLSAQNGSADGVETLANSHTSFNNQSFYDITARRNSPPWLQPQTIRKTDVTERTVLDWVASGELAEEKRQEFLCERPNRMLPEVFRGGHWTTFKIKRRRSNSLPGLLRSLLSHEF